MISHQITECFHFILDIVSHRDTETERDTEKEGKDRKHADNQETQLIFHFSVFMNNLLGCKLS